MKAYRVVATILAATALAFGATSPDDPVTALVIASGRGDLTTVKSLLDAKVDADATPKLGSFRAIEAAIQNGHLDVVQLLLAAGADPNAKGAEMSPLIWAANGGRLEMVRALLAAKADVNRVSGIGGRTPLLEAIHNNH